MEKIAIAEKLTYLVKDFPKRHGVYKKCVKRLNDKGLKTNTGVEYTFDIVRNVINGKKNDDMVRIELLQMKDELKGRVSAVSNYLDAAEKLLNAASK